MTIKDIASLAGVSPATVSKVLNNKADSIAVISQVTGRIALGQADNSQILHSIVLMEFLDHLRLQEAPMACRPLTRI